MTKLNEIYKCEICGNIVEVLHEGPGVLVCCGKPMILQNAQTLELEGNEKHIPVLEENDSGIIVKIGSVPHPMTEEHYIEWVELVTEDGVYRKMLDGKNPFVEFSKPIGKIVSIREYCNIHGLWEKVM